MRMYGEQKWTETIEAKHFIFDLRLGEVWRYRDLLYMLVKRDFVTFYKQTILGPLWFLIQPLLSTVMFYYVFVVMASTQNEGIESFLFILSGQVIWNYFSESLSKVSTVFKDNANMFGKVYFPRLIMPLSITTSGLIKFGVQFIIFLCFYIYAYLTSDNLNLTWWILSIPILLVTMGMFALGLGMIFSSLTTKYKDLIFLLSFGISLYMYITPVVYPMSAFKGTLKNIAEYNPLSGVFICFREAFIGNQDFQFSMLVYSIISTFVIFALGTLIFNKVEKSFMDSI